MIEYVESRGEGTLLSHGVAENITIAGEGEFVICESKDVPGAFAVFQRETKNIVRFRHCGPDCETGK